MAVVINLQLWLMHLKKKELKFPVLQKLHAYYYLVKKIEAARDLLYENFPIKNRPSALRKKQRQGDSKANNIVKDNHEVLQFMFITNKFA